ncbi:uncharacterized protein LOC122082655 [Macadamia integrifolia]|uniref:uncharacterized protein LOC122082655 n=1 Tax=Macadamia integrifolia TaxID=60698 RepID=UPI001C4F049D|nr:uncharacterized protein LOC122082655 [Macadamia integrifolia]
MVFADDIIFFGRAYLQESLNLQRIFNIYCTYSGQEINIPKTRAQFSPNVISSTKRLLRQHFRISSNLHLDQYLGIPFIGTPGPAGIGGLVRDWNGNFLWGFSEYSGCTCSYVAEAFAVRRVLLIAISKGIHNLIVEGDNRLIIQLLQGNIQEAP